MTEIQEITQAILQFRDERDWAQYHNGKDLALCLSIEASELLECFLWKQPEEAELPRIKDELADVLYSAFLLTAHYGLDVKQIVMDKLEKNREKYPVEKAKGSRRKYDEL
jgi:NTP pyrophosphatase (non-canonical NTP hydrolase)